MRYSGPIGEDAPDPAIALRDRARELPVPVHTFVSQPHLERWDAPSIETSSADGVEQAMAVSLSYTYWHNPARRDDPANLAELSDELRRSLDTTPPWPRPRWLIERVEHLRYPTLWEAVRTAWHADSAQRPSVADALADHTNHVLNNHSRSPESPTRFVTQVDARHVQAGIAVTIDDHEVEGVQLDTDPSVYALGAELGPHSIVTVVVDREAAARLTLALTSRTA